MHEVDGPLRAASPQHLQAVGFKRVGLQGRIVAHPNLEQIAQNEERISLAVVQGLLPSSKCCTFSDLEVNVRQEGKTTPMGRRVQL
jgi:hypothetical protein